MGRDLTVEDMFAVLPDILEVPPEEQDAYARPRVFVELRATNVIDDLLGLVDELGPDLIVRETGELASWAVAERRSIPHVAVNVGAFTTTAEWDALAGPWLADLGRRVSLDRLDAASMYRFGVLAFEPAGYHDWADAPTARVFRPEVRTAPPIDDPAIERLDERPLVYVTLGTEFYDPELMRTILHALAGGDWNVVATTGPGADPDIVDPGAPGIVVARWIPHDAITQRAALIVSHAGGGTVVGGLVRGVPAVCLPLGADQFHHAGRVEELGAGLALGADQRTPDQIRRAVDHVLSDARYRDSAVHLATETARLPDLDRAVDHLEGLA